MQVTKHWIIKIKELTNIRYMDIILDTNIFANDIKLKSNDVLLLLDYLDRTKSKILMPLVILEETKGLYNRNIIESISDANKHISIIHKSLLSESDRPALIKLETDKMSQEYIEYILDTLNIENKQIIDYDPNHIPDIVNRAIYRRKPMDQKGNGFRDCIIWNTLLSEAKKAFEKQLIFISNNILDFSTRADPANLHNELKEECDKKGVTINFFSSLKDFIKNYSTKIEIITIDWLSSRLPEDILCEEVVRSLNTSKHELIVNHLDFGFADPSGEYEVKNANVTDYKDISVYELSNEKIIVNAEIELETEIEAGYLDYGYEYFNYGHSPSHWGSTTHYLLVYVEISISIEKSRIDEIEEFYEFAIDNIDY